MYQFRMNIDGVLLEKQINDLVELADGERLNRHVNSLEGVLDILSAMKDQIHDFETYCPDKLEPEEVPVREMTDRLAVCICEGVEIPQSDDEFIRAWQHIINKRIAWTIQGSFGRIADRMIAEGICAKPPEKKLVIIPTFNKVIEGVN